MEFTAEYAPFDLHDLDNLGRAFALADIRSVEDAATAVRAETPASRGLHGVGMRRDVGVVQFGPADYAISIGLAGQWSHPDVQAAERATIETALKKGLHPRVEIGSPAEAAPYMDMGVKHFCMGWDVGILHGWWRDNGRQMREVLRAERRG